MTEIDTTARYVYTDGDEVEVLAVGKRAVFVRWLVDERETTYGLQLFRDKFIKVEPHWEEGKYYRSLDSRKMLVRVTAVDDDGDALIRLINGTGAHKQVFHADNRRFWKEEEVKGNG